MWWQETRGKEWRGKKNEACALQSYLLLWRVWSQSSSDQLRNPVERAAEDPSGKEEKEALPHETLLPGIMVSLETVLIHTNSSRLSQLPALQGKPEAEIKKQEDKPKGDWMLEMLLQAELTPSCSHVRFGQGCVEELKGNLLYT